MHLVFLLFSISKSRSAAWLAWELRLCSIDRHIPVFPVVTDREGKKGSRLLCSTVCVCTTVQTCFESSSADMRRIPTLNAQYFPIIHSFGIHPAVYTLGVYSLRSATSSAQYRHGCKWFYLWNCVLSFVVFELLSATFADSFSFIFGDCREGCRQRKFIKLAVTESSVIRVDSITMWQL